MVRGRVAWQHPACVCAGQQEAVTGCTAARIAHVVLLLLHGSGHVLTRPCCCLLHPAEQSPYLKSSSSSSKPAQPSSTGSTGLASPRSPRAKTTTVGSTGNSGAYSRQQLGALYSSSHDPVGRTRPGAASSTSSKVSCSRWLPCALPCRSRRTSAGCSWFLRWVGM